jgi:enoyl-CoA hydratase/carnithine racemase
LPAKVKVGVFLMQVMGLFQDLVPRRILREWALPGEPFSAHEVKGVGLVNPVAPPQRWTLKRNG